MLCIWCTCRIPCKHWAELCGHYDCYQQISSSLHQLPPACSINKQMNTGIQYTNHISANTSKKIWFQSEVVFGPMGNMTFDPRTNFKMVSYPWHCVYISHISYIMVITKTYTPVVWQMVPWSQGCLQWWGQGQDRRTWQQREWSSRCEDWREGWQDDSLGESAPHHQ